MASKGTMKAWLYANTAGGLEKNMELKQDAPIPTEESLGKGEVLIQVLAMSPNPIDHKLAEMPLVGSMLFKRPATPGSDVCGKVTATHAAEKTLKVGQLVFGQIGLNKRYGSLAEFCVANSQALAVVPDGVKAEDAVCAGTTGQTAYQCIVPTIKDKPYTPKVFINGGSGGTGTFGIQFAKVYGAEVVASCSTGNVELCKSLGADEVIDYKNQDVVETLKAKGQVFDLIVDNVGASPANLYSESEHYLKPTGKYVQVGGGFGPSAIASTASRMMRPGFLGGGKRPYQFLTMAPNSQHLGEIAKWMQEGKVKPIYKTMQLEQGAEAYAALKSGRSVGNIVVKIS